MFLAAGGPGPSLEPIFRMYRVVCSETLFLANVSRFLTKNMVACDLARGYCKRIPNYWTECQQLANAKRIKRHTQTKKDTQ